MYNTWGVTITITGENRANVSKNAQFWPDFVAVNLYEAFLGCSSSFFYLCMGPIMVPNIHMVDISFEMRGQGTGLID